MQHKSAPPPASVRSPTEVARRALALFSVVGIGLGAPRDDIIDWLRAESLWEELSPAELVFVTDLSPAERQIIWATWQSEALVVLVWALHELPSLPELSDQCDTARFQDVLPPFADISVDAFIRQARLRPSDELLAMADELERRHAQARNPSSTQRPKDVDIEIVQERHRAINWIVGYEGLAWDEVTTDT